MMKILIVGGAGYLGGAVTDILSEQKKHEFRVYDALLYENSYLKSVDFVYGDIRDHKKLLPQLKWADAVVWLAALVGDGACAVNPDITIELNNDAVGWLAEHYNGRIIFTSTCSVYGAMDGILDEKSPTNPLSVYAVTKLAAEKKLYGKNAMVFRLGTLFGLSDQFSRIRLDLVVNTLTVKAYAEKKLTIFGGKQYRPILHVRDAAQTIVDNLDTKHKGIYNIHQQNIKIIDLADEVKKHFTDLKVEKVDMKFEDSRNYRVSSEKAKKTFNFAPKLTATDGIKELKKILEEGRIKDWNNPIYTNQTCLAEFGSHRKFPQKEWI